MQQSCWAQREPVRAWQTFSDKCLICYKALPGPQFPPEIFTESGLQWVQKGSSRLGFGVFNLIYYPRNNAIVLNYKVHSFSFVGRKMWEMSKQIIVFLSRVVPFLSIMVRNWDPEGPVKAPTCSDLLDDGGSILRDDDPILLDDPILRDQPRIPEASGPHWLEAPRWSSGSQGLVAPSPREMSLMIWSVMGLNGAYLELDTLFTERLA